MQKKLFILAVCFVTAILPCIGKPKVWIISDMTDKTLPGGNKEGTINDPDDISAMAGYLLMANEFETLGIVVGSTHRKEHATTPNQAQWANTYFGQAYAKDLPGLKTLGDYPARIPFIQSSIKESAERFNPNREYDSLKPYPSIAALFQALEKEDGTVNVLCWGSLTEPAILVNHCLNHGRDDLLKKTRFIAHWTNSSLHQGTPEHPEHVANCREDAKACAYLKAMAKVGLVDYRECGAIGQHGIVSGAPKGKAYYDQFHTSALGTIFVEGKFVFNGVDHSDSATYWTLLGDWGVKLDDITSTGTNDPETERANEAKFKARSHDIHNELLRRSNAAGIAHSPALHD
ncbi:nucleoside hydrolase-like domain-containing protein [Pontiella desulfatans]|nr:nucleoside hydrolase-like domain-containing protein [Pontiella desulfatans]